MKSPLENRAQDALALLILRVGCAWFIFVWAVNKFLAPAQYQQLAKNFDKISLDETTVLIIAGVQVAICLCVFVGFARLYTYALLAMMHGYSVYRQWPKYLDPFEINGNGFPVNRNVSISLCALLAMIALWLLRHRDHWSVDAAIRGKSR